MAAALQACRDGGSNGDEPDADAAEPSDDDASASDAGADADAIEGGMDAATDSDGGAEPFDAGEEPIDAGDELFDGGDEPLDATDGEDSAPDQVVPPAPGLVLLFDPSPRATSEARTQFSFQLSLSTAPSAVVTVPVAVSDAAEARAVTSSLSFSPTDWSGPKVVLIEGVDDAPPVKDGDVDYEVTIGPTSSADPAYDGVTAAPIALVNEDDDTPGVRATPELVGANTTLKTTEAGGSARLSLSLRTRPRQPVTIPVASSDLSEGVVHLGSLTIEPDAWDSVNWITVTGVDEGSPVADGERSYQIVVGPTESADADYDDLPIERVSVVNEDNDLPALVVTPEQTPLLTTELGNRLRWVELKLLTKPQAEVRVPVATTKVAEAVADLPELRFNDSNWAVGQRIHVRGVADSTQDGMQTYEVVFGPTTSSDARYEGLVSRVTGTNYDVDTADILLTYDGALQTTERGGRASLHVQLTKPPSANVSVPFTILPTAAGTPRERLEGAVETAMPVVFTPSNYGSAREIVIVGEDDALIDGDQRYFVRVGPAVSGDATYDGKVLPNVELINQDDDAAGMIVTAVGPAQDGRLRLDEPGPDYAEFTVRLATQPSAPVTVTFTSSDPSEGTPPPPLVFVPSAPATGQQLWSAAQTARVEVVDDLIQDGPVDFHVRLSAASADPAYNTAAIEELVMVRAFDDGDSAGLSLEPVASSLLAVTEPAGTTTFTLRLTSTPTSAVTIPIIASDASEGVLSEAGLPLPAGGIVIEPAGWNAARTITLTGVRDDLADGEQTYQVVLGPTTSLDRLYHGKTALFEAITHDTDTASIIYDGVPVPPLYSAITREAPPRQAAPIRLRLTSMPRAPVTLGVSVAEPDADEATVTPAVLTFTETDWADPTAHQVIVTGVDDAIDDGDREYTLVFAPATSMDAQYNSLTPTPATLMGITLDDADAFGITVSGGPLELFEEGTTQELRIALRSQPTQPVTVTVNMAAGAGRDPTAAVLGHGEQTGQRSVEVDFQPAAWNVPKVVTVTGRSDMQRLGHRAMAVELAAASTDEHYEGLSSPEVTGTVYDVPRSCKSALALWSMTATGTGEYEIDTDLDPATPWHFAHCDMETDGGGWTLLVYSGDTAAYGGVPYPGHGAGSAPYCLIGAGSAACSRGSGLPLEDLPALLAVSTELGQGQATPAGAMHDPYAPRLIDYDFGGRYHYGAALAELELGYGPGTCTPFAVGTYFDLVGTAELDETPVNLAEAFRSPLPGNYGAIENSYTWSIGSPGPACAMSTAAPVSYLGTWQDAQYGPQATGATGAFSVWIR